MKERMKRLSILFMTAALCSGQVCAQEPAGTEAVQQETGAEQTETAGAQTEQQTAGTEAQTEAAGSETERTTEAPAPSETAASRTHSTEAQTETGKQEASGTEASEQESSGTKETGKKEASGQESSGAKETEKKEAALLVADADGKALKPEPLDVPKTLTADGKTYPVDYLQGVCRVKVPAGSRTLRITVPDQKDGEKLSITKWSGYLTEEDRHWYLCADDPIPDAYTVQDDDASTYVLDLNRFALSMEELTKEQLAVYGDLAEETKYAEVLVTGEGRSELLLIEFASEQAEEDAAGGALPAESDTDGTEPDTDAESDTEQNTESEADTESDTEVGSEQESESESESEMAVSLLGETAIPVVLSASAASVDQAYTAAGKNLSSSAVKSTPTVASINGEWQILGLSRSGKLDEAVLNKYLTNVINTLKDKNGVLHAKKYTEYSRVVLALTSVGVDVTNVAGYNLLKPLADYDQTVWQGVNGATWALIAFDSHNYEIPQAESGKTQNSREKLIENILSQEVSGGGWDLSGRSADPDVTAMAIQALAPYYETNAQVKAAVDRGISRLSAMQKKNGSYATYGSETSESCSQVIVALTALGIDPNTDSRFVKNGKSVVDALLTYANADGSFKHVLSGTANQMATEQAYYALTAYERFTGGKTRLYDMTDVELPSDREKAASVEKLIEALPKVPKLTDKAQIAAARAMYDSLNEMQKSLVGNYSRMEEAEKELQKLEKNSSSTESTESDKNSGSGSNKPGTGGTGSTGGTKKPGGSTKKVNLVSGGSGSKRTGGTPAGKTTAAGTSGKSDASEKETEQESETATEKKEQERVGGTKTEKEVTGLIAELNRLYRKSKTSEALPDDAADYTDAQKEQLLDIYRTYTDLTDDQKKEVEQSGHYEDYQKSLELWKESNHYDAAAGIDLRDNEEDVLPWYVQVVASPLSVEAEQAEQVEKALKEQGELLNMTDISLIDLLENTEWEPEDLDLVRVSVPLADLGSYDQVAIAHLKDDGTLEFIDGHIAGSQIEFDTDQFSRFGVVGYNGSMEELMAEDEPEGKPVWMYLIPGAGAAALLAIVAALRLTLSRKGRRKKEDDGER